MLYFLFHSFLFWFGAIWLTVGGFFVGLGVDEVLRSRDAQHRSLAAEGVVLSKMIHHANRGDTPRTRYEIEYRFVAGGLDYVRRADVSVDQWEGLREGGTVAVWYLPDDFHTSRLTQPGGGGAEWVGVGLGAVFAIVGGGLVLRELPRAKAKVAIGPL